ncbi:MAG: CsbD family protein [Spirochaetales bacterium]
MNKDVLKGKWKQVTGEAKKKWGKLTDNDLTRAEGDSEKLAGILQERYGYSKEEANREVNEWTSSLS